MTGVTPWNYGNYYLGNTTMQIMPLTLSEPANLRRAQALLALRNARPLDSAAMPSSMPSYMGNSMPSSFNMPRPMFSSNSMSMMQPMMATATPLPVAYNPLVQGMFPMASTNPISWMTPSSFMTALTSGPMPYRPPANDFPNNVGMVMAIPYGTRNPMLSASSYNSSSNNAFSSCGCSNSYPAPPTTAATAQPAANYYPCPVAVPQSYSLPQPYPASQSRPVGQSYPVSQPYSALQSYPASQSYLDSQPYSALQPYPKSQSYLSSKSYSASCSSGAVPSDGQQGASTTVLSSMSPPIATTYTQSRPFSNDASQGGVICTACNVPTMVAASNSSIPSSGVIGTQSRSLPVYDVTDQSQLLIGRKVTPTPSNVRQDNNAQLGVTPSQLKYGKSSESRDSLYQRVRRHLPKIPILSHFNYSRSHRRREPVLPPILNGYLVSDSGWLPKQPESERRPSFLGYEKIKRLSNKNENPSSTVASTNGRVSFLPRGSRQTHSSSSVSEYDCAICQQEREKQRLREYYNSSTVSSLTSSKGSSRRRSTLSPNESISSSKGRHSASYQSSNHRSHRPHSKKIKAHSKGSSKKSNSPVLIRRTPLEDQRQQFNDTHSELNEESVGYNKNNQYQNRNDDDDESTNDGVTGKPEAHASRLSVKTDDD